MDENGLEVEYRVTAVVMSIDRHCGTRPQYNSLILGSSVMACMSVNPNGIQSLCLLSLYSQSHRLLSQFVKVLVNC